VNTPVEYVDLVMYANSFTKKHLGLWFDDAVLLLNEGSLKGTLVEAELEMLLLLFES
jgi:hypothetical protein